MGLLGSLGLSTSESSGMGTDKTYTQLKWLNDLIKMYGPQAGMGEDVYQGERVAPLSSWQQSLLQTGQGFGDLFKPGGQMPLFGETGAALQGLLSGTTGAEKITPEQTSSLFENVYKAPAIKRWTEETSPAIREAFAGPGYWGSARAKEQAKGAKDLGDWLGTKRGELEWGVSETNRAIDEAKAARAQTAVGQGMQYGQLPTMEARNRMGGMLDVFNFADVGRRQRQAQIMADMQKFAEENRITKTEDLQILMALLGIPVGYQQQSESRQQYGYEPA